MNSGVENGSHRAFSRVTLLFGGVVVSVFTLLFILPWWNRYLGITNEGWYQFFGEKILEGRIPYRDFYLFVPPGQPLTIAALTSVFGNRIVVPELFGYAGALVLALALYFWLARFVPRFWVTVAVVSTIALYLRVSTESLSGLHLDANLYPVLALLSGSLALDRTHNFRGLSILAGFWMGMAFITKQTAGVAMTVSIGILLPAIFAARSEIRAGLHMATMLAIGWILPVCNTSIWLVMHGAF